MKRVLGAAARTSALVSALISALAAVSGCGVRGKDPSSVITRRLEGEPKTLNPLLTNTDPESIVAALVARNLLDYDESLNLIPGLAESIEDSGDHLTYTVHLRDARWEDGTPVTSADVAYTLKALVDPKTPPTARRSNFDALKAVEAVDARTARVVFTAPYAYRKDAFNLPLLPAALYAGKDIATNERNRSPLANGPYRLAKWDAGRAIELVRNTQYFGEKPPAERIVLRVVPETAPAFQGLLTGELDETRLTPEQLKRIDADRDKPGATARSLVWDELAYTYIAWNNRLPQFSEAKVRRALTMLIDREVIARTIYGGLAKPANGPVPPGLWTYDPALAPWPFDPAAASRLLDEAGWRKGPDGVRRKGKDRFAFTLSLGAGSDLQRQIVELAQQTYRAAGIEMNIRPMEWASFSANFEAGDFEAAAIALNLDPNPDMTANWHSAQIPPIGVNSVFYKSPKADALMDELKTTFDRGRAKELYKELQRVIHEDEPVSFLHIVSLKWGITRRIENVKTSPIGLSLFWPGVSGWRPVRATRPI